MKTPIAKRCSVFLHWLVFARKFRSSMLIRWRYYPAAYRRSTCAFASARTRTDRSRLDRADERIWGNEIAFVRAHGQYRARCRADHAFGHAPHQQMLDAAAAVRPGHDQIDLMRPRVAVNRVRDIDAAFDDRFDREGSPII